MRLVIGITGTTGVIYGIRLLELLKAKEVETCLVISKAAEQVIKHETSTSPTDLKKLASFNYDVDDLDAPISSGSFTTNGMVIVPCSMKTLAGIACGYSENLVLRAADVTLKEKRPLILVTRETPLGPTHLGNMLKLAECGAAILPPVPAFYHKPRTIDDIVASTVGKILEALGLEHELYSPWKSKG